MMGARPPFLDSIGMQCAKRQDQRAQIEALEIERAVFVRELREVVPDVCCEGDGTLVYTGTLSPGCRACRDGVWDCIFVTLRCNLDCAFCDTPLHAPRDYCGSVFGGSPEEISACHARSDVRAISFSGGEPFLEPERLFGWIERFRALRPDQYCWLYTNGVLVTEAHIERLAQLGVHEMRFNLAATGYHDAQVLNRVRYAAQRLERVTVEIPVIPEHGPQLLAALPTWVSAGVRHLNLHELLYEPDTNADRLPGSRREVLAPDGHRTWLNPESRCWTLEAMRLAHIRGWNLSINDCSWLGKLQQLSGRRRILAPLTQAPHEQLEGDRLVSYCGYGSAEDSELVHPDDLCRAQARHPTWRWVRLVRLAPLACDASALWLECREL